MKSQSIKLAIRVFQMVTILVDGCVVVSRRYCNLHFSNKHSVESAFVSFSPTRRASMVKCLFKSFIIFFIGLFVILVSIGRTSNTFELTNTLTK